jgi:hypothetical protein
MRKMQLSQPAIDILVLAQHRPTRVQTFVSSETINSQQDTTYTITVFTTNEK